MYKYYGEGNSLIKITLSKAAPSIDTNIAFREGEDFARSLLPFSSSSYLQLGLLELKGVDNPADYTIQIQHNGNKTSLPLYKYRTQFLHYKGMFIMDLKNKNEFGIDISQQYFSISLLANGVDENFELKMYGEFVKTGGISFV